MRPQRYFRHCVAGLSRPTSIGYNEHECLDGLCVRGQPECNGIFECSDGSDEAFSLCRSRRCALPQRPENGVYRIVSETSLDDANSVQLEYACSFGFKLVGEVRVLCGEAWPELPYCVQCGKLIPKLMPSVLGGETTRLGDVPWHIGIYRKGDSSDQYQQICGGSLISNTVVLSGEALCRGNSGGGLSFASNISGVERYYLRGIASTSPLLNDRVLQRQLSHQLHVGHQVRGVHQTLPVRIGDRRSRDGKMYPMEGEGSHVLRNEKEGRGEGHQMREVLMF
ncbi:unnamed protein product, partial [Iphiclides podalirius]